MRSPRMLPVALAIAFAAGLFCPGGGGHAAEKIAPGVVGDLPPGPKAPENTAVARLEPVTDWYEAVGTVRPRTELRISARVTALITAIRVRPGAAVDRDQLLITLDDRQLLSRLDQARQALNAAKAGERQALQAVLAGEAAYEEAASAYRRVRTYYESQAATLQDVERAESAYRQAEAGLEQARQALAAAKAQIRQAEEVVNEASIAISYTRIKAPETGEVLEWLVEPGDMALPGKPLITMRTSGSLRLEAHVREGLIPRVSVGENLTVALSTLERTVDARVEEIIPYADPRTRTFLVKAALPEIRGLYPGMFGKLLIPIRKHPAVVIPGAAVRRVGQLELVTVREGENWFPVYIRTGRTVDGGVEVLSGLGGDEIVGWGN